jgi:alanine racemase
VTVVLHVDSPAWRNHVNVVNGRLGESLIPVVKGNGYGFGRRAMARHSLGIGRSVIAIGTIHELEDVADLAADFIVLTPSLDPHLDALPKSVTLTVGSWQHYEHLQNSRPGGPPPIVKLHSSMLRYGFADVPDIAAAAYAIHPPLVGTDTDHTAEIEHWLDRLDPAVTVDVSHVSVDGFVALQQRHPNRRFRLRSGTALWLGDKSSVRLRATVLDVHEVAAGERAGYRLAPVPDDGHVILIGAGTANGVFPNQPGDLSPFHFARRQLTLLEAPHMHTSMAFVPRGAPCPNPGDEVDLQRPLINTQVDRVEWED